MWQDPIVEEVRAIRDAYAKEFGYDIQAISRDLRERERQSGRRLMAPEPRRLKAVDSAL